MSSIHIKNLRKDFGTQRALADISLKIENGTLLALLGPSGCGKSTTLQLLAGFEEPTAGEIWADDQLLSSAKHVVGPEKRGVSLVFQNYAVWPHKTVAENVAFGLKLKKFSSSEIDRRLTTVLQTVQLGALRDRYPSELSGGQQQRVALARALAVEPKILLLDEPLSNLDASLREEMRFEIRRVHEALGITTVLVTHDQADALATADQIAVMHAGRVDQIGPPEELFGKPANAFVATFIGSNNELKGDYLGDGRVQVGDVVVRGLVCTALPAGQQVSLCIRPSKIALVSGEAVLSDTGHANSLPGVVVRSSYLGEYRDVSVRTPQGQVLRVHVPPHIHVSAGDAVIARLPVEDCQVLTPSQS
ncbi:MAG: ABC transporter ATP-binding protein [Comamonadaceae bacterium]|nr:MAG: ABC transporter ATP-binding protein [Comamonadaceae bacterium]